MDCLPQIHAVAIHAQAGYETVTPGIGVLCRSDQDWLLGTGVVRNSQGSRSLYAMGGWQPLRVGPLKVGAVIGAVNGYSAYKGGFGPMGGVFATYRHMHLLWIPPTPKSAAALAVSFTFNF